MIFQNMMNKGIIKELQKEIESLKKRLNLLESGEEKMTFMSTGDVVCVKFGRALYYRIVIKDETKWVQFFKGDGRMMAITDYQGVEILEKYYKKALTL